MKINLLLVLACLLCLPKTQFAQNVFPASGSTGIGTTAPNSSSLLEIKSTTKGVLLPRMTQTQRNAINSPATGLLIFQTDQSKGLYYWSGSTWTSVTQNNVRGLNNNLLIGSTAGHALTTGLRNIALGRAALYSIVTGKNCIAIGDSSLFDNTANENIAIGYLSQANNTIGESNIAIGIQTLYTNKSAGYNVAVGNYALGNDTSGDYNTAIGTSSLYNNRSGDYNTGTGYQSLSSNSSGLFNTANGANALYYNSTGYYNTAVGYLSQYSNTTAYFNTAVGSGALYANQASNANTAVGYEALHDNTAIGNTALGMNALKQTTTGTYNTGCGLQALNNNTTGTNNVAVGYNSGSFGLANIKCTYIGNDSRNSSSSAWTGSLAIGEASRITASTQARIGSTTVNSIGGYANWTNLSDGRYKKNVQENVKGLEFIKLLRPVTYNLKVTELNNFLNIPNDAAKQKLIEAKEQQLQSGFIAQEVEAAAIKTGYNFSGVDKPQNNEDLYGLRYAEFTVPLVKAVQELDNKVITENQQLKDRVEALELQLKEIRNAVSPGNENRSETKVTAEGPQLIISPNPATEKITLLLRANGQLQNLHAKILDSTGKEIFDIPVFSSNKQIEINTTGYNSGSYLVKVYEHDQLMQSAVFIIHK